MPWTVMTWNVLFGGQDRWERILALLARERPDLLVLQECLDWEDGVRLAEAARAIGAEHTFLATARPRGSGKRYHVALISREPMRRREVHNDPGALGHCIAEVDVSVAGQVVTVLGTHFDSHHEDKRVVEAAYVRELVARSRLHHRPAVLTGDLNALRRADPYPADLAARVAGAGIDKYGHPPRFDTMDALEAQGWVDTLPARLDPRAWPTARRRGVDFRTDYVLATPPLAAALVEARVVPAEGASDHDAVLATFTT